MTTLSVLAGAHGDRGLVVALKLVDLEQFGFVGLVEMSKVTTITVDAGCRGAETSSFGSILIRK